MNWKLLRFFISVRVPRVSTPLLRTERLTSQRIEPSFIRQSDTPV